MNHDSGEKTKKLLLQGIMKKDSNGNWIVYLPYTNHIGFVQDEIVEVTIDRRYLV